MPFIVKNTTFPSLLDLLAPHSCRGCGSLGSPLCARCKNYIISHPLHICPACKAPSKHGQCNSCKDLPPIFIVGERDELVGLLIHDFKFHSVRALARPLAELASATLPDFNSNVAIVPLPTIAHHIRTRALDHTYLIAKHLAKLRGPDYHVERLLLRARDTVQVGTDRTTRLQQASSAYTLNPKLQLDPDTTYLLLDDVWTTGASMRAAYALLQKAGARHIASLILALSR